MQNLNKVVILSIIYYLEVKKSNLIFLENQIDPNLIRVGPEQPERPEI
jgi:hypothetical protein